jgi:hypothetical protein
MNKLIDLMTNLTPDKKAELEKVDDEIMDLAGQCKTPEEHRRVSSLLKTQGEILGWKEG